MDTGSPKLPLLEDLPVQYREENALNEGTGACHTDTYMHTALCAV
jgi:hypothetical protein